MIKVIIFLAAILFSLSTIAQTKKDAAESYQVQGMYIFMQAKPVADYTVLGTVKKTGLVWNGRPTEMFNTILRRAKKDFPDCEGVVFDGVDMQHATCIKFK